MAVVYITSMDHFASVVSGTRPIIIEFWAEWCATCKPMTELFDQLAAQNPAGEFYRLDIEEVREVSQELGVRNLPAFKVFVKGVQIGELVGKDPVQLTRLVYKTLSM
ncbi:thioredoxin [Boletus edulis BED1]|uniref:Thioredoxin n=1 Tax=Boletus edulis BED1 TaxID=1328754 RepID=A0AAD4BBK7_BOLED|nr:thioredoxin [Boletus edulis BED1]KAF8435693.1 thioredoxin [Boletus edulis BED1]